MRKQPLRHSCYAVVCGLVVLLWVALVTPSLGQIRAGQRGLYLVGQLLVAAPEMHDPRFSEAVIYMIAHTKEGAMGLVVNRPLARGSISDLLESLGVESAEGDIQTVLYYGGPVELGKGFILHTNDYVQKGTQIVDGAIAVTVDVEILRALARGEGPRRSLIIMGYAGWAPGQLEAEMRRNDWFSIPAEESLIFDDDWKTKWKRASEKRRIKT